MAWSLSRRYDVFISYSRDAADFATQIEARLEADGLRVFRDRNELPFGKEYDATLERAASTCRCFLFVMSKRSVEPDSYARTELNWARQANRNVFAAFAKGHEGVTPPAVLTGTSFITGDGEPIALIVSTLRNKLRCRRWPLVACGALTLGVSTALLMLLRASEPAPVGNEQARIQGASLMLGFRSTPQFLAMCRSLQATDSECDELIARQSAPTVNVETFDIDRDEITGRDFAIWANAMLRTGRLKVSDDMVARATDGVQIWLPNCHGIGSYLIEQGEVRTCTSARCAVTDVMLPVICVSAVGAEWFCSDRAKRLPTEAEWELAAGGAQKRWFPWGNEWTKANCADAIFARYDGGQCQDKLHVPERVGTQNRDQTIDGVSALGSNVSEWVRGSSEPDPEYVVKGGSWAGLAVDLMTAKRLTSIDAGDAQRATIGFRCAKSLDR